MPRRRLLGFAAAAALVAAACFTDATGPRLVPRAALAVLPTWANPLSAGAPVATVHIVARRSDGSVAKDTTFTYPTGADSLVVNLNVPLGSGAVSGSEPFAVRFDLLGAAGDTLFQGGPVTLTGYGSGKAPAGQGVVSVPVTYTGPGKNAATVQALVPDTSVLFGDSVTLTAIARDAQGAPLPGTLVAWTSTDTTKVKVRTKFGGRLIGGTARGIVKVAASTLTGQSDTVRVTVQPVASQLALASGNAQSAPGGAKLPLPLKVAVTAADAGPVRGVAVAWSITSAGGGTLSAATTFTDSLGIAADTLTLPAAAGPVTVRAAVGTITGSPVTFTATALPTTPTKLAFTVNPPATTPAGAAIAPVITVAEQDGAGNTVPSAQDSIVIALGANPAGGTLGGTLRVKAVNGVATFSTLSLNKAGAGYTLVASAPGTSLTGATSTSFAVTAGAPTSLLVLQDPTNAAALAAITPVVSIAVVDALGNTVSGATNAVTVAIQTGSGTAGAVLGGTTTVNAVNGIASFPGLTVNKVGVSYRLTATATGLGSTLTAPFNIGPGTVASVAYGVAPPATATSLTGFSATVQLLDAGGNLVTTATDTVTLTLGTSPGGATITGTAKAAAVAGVATFSGILLDRAGNYTLVATRAGTPSAVSGTITLVPGAAAALTYQVAPSGTGSAGVALATQPVVQVVDAAGNVVTSASGTMTAASLPAATALIGGSAPIVNGVATFSGFAVGATVGSKQLTFSNGTFTSAASTLVLAAGPPSQVLPDSGAFQGGIVNLAVGTPLVARVLDAWTNVVPGATVTFALTGGAGTLGTPSSVSDVNGRARTTFTLGSTLGSNTVSATVAGVGAPASFTAFGAPSGTTATWVGTTSTNYATASNWSPALVPAGGDNAFVPTGTPFAPVLTANQALNQLTVMPGVAWSLGGFTLTVGGLDAGTAMTGSGLIVASGSGGSLKGLNIPALTVSNANVLSGRTTVLGATTVTAGSLNPNGNTLVTGSLTTSTSGFIAGTNPVDSIIVQGNATFGGGNSVPTGGVLLVGGNFAQATNATAFVPGAGHTTVFNGSAAQTVSFANVGTSGFGSVTFANAAGVSTLGSGLAASGTVSVTAGTVSGSAAVLAGDLADPNAGWSFTATTFSKTGTLSLPARLGGTVSFSPAGASTATLSGPVRFTGPGVTVGSGILEVTTHSDTVDGVFTTSGSGGLKMVTAGGDLFIKGTASFGGTGTTLTAGTLRLGADFAQSGLGANFAAGAGHTTVLQGTVAQNVAFAAPGAGTFGALAVNNPAGVALGTNVFAAGPVTVTAGTVSGAVTATLADNLTDAGGATPLWQVGNTTFTKAGALTLPVRVASATTFAVSGASTATLQGNTRFQSSVSLTSGTLAVLTHADTVDGAFSTSVSGGLRMVTAGGSIVFNGAATFGGNNSVLTAGSTIFKGNLSTTVPTSSGYNAAATHATIFAGTTAQVVSISGPSLNQLGTTTFSNPAGVSFPAAATFAGDVSVASGAVTASGVMTLAGNLTDAGGASPLWQAGTTTFTKAGSVTLPTRLLNTVTFNVAGAGTATPTGPVWFSGTLQLTGGALAIGAFKDSVTGGFTITGTGGLVMGTAGGEFTVGGNASFGGTGTSLTLGILRLRGAFSQTGAGVTFSAGASHLTRFEGATTQSASLATPATNPFGGLTIATTGGVTFNSNAVVVGTDSVVGAGTNVTSAVGDTVFLNNAGGVALVDPNGRWRPDFTVLGGAGSPGIPTTMFGTVVVNAARTLAANLTVTGSLIVNTPLTVAGRTLVVGGTPGTLLVQGASTGLVMTNATDSVDVVSATFQGSDQTGNLTNGKLVVRGNFVQNSLVSTKSFAAFGIHTTSFVTTGTNTITFQNSDSTTSRFNAVEFRGPGQMTLQSPVYAGSAVSTIAGSGANVVGGANGSLYSFGTLSVAAGTTLGSSGAKLRLLGFAGNASVSGTATADTALVYGAGRSILVPAALTRTYLLISTSATQSSLSTCALTDTVIISGAGSVLNRGTCAPFSMQGLKVLNGGVLAMTGAADSIIVVGDALFNGGSSAGFLTAGSLVLRGNFTQLATGSGASFQASGSHKTHLSPTVGKPLVSFASPGLGTTASRFQNLFVPTTAGVVDTLGTQVFVADTLNYGRTIAAGRGLAITSGQPLVVGVIFDTTSGGGVLRGAAGATLRVRNRFNGIPATYAIDTTVVDTTSGAVNVPTFLPAGTALKHVVVEGFARGNSGQTISGDLEVRASGRFRLDSGTTFTVTGSLRTAQSGTLGMNSTGGLVTLNVSGNATFAGGSTSGILVSGNLNVAGSFTQGGAATAFAPSSGHNTILTGDNTKTITFANPDTLFNGLASSFTKVTMNNINSLPSLASDIAARDSVIMPPITGRTMASTGGLRAIYTRGASMFNTTFTDIRLVLNRASILALGSVGSLSWQGSSYGTLPMFEVNGGGLASLPTITSSSLNFSAAGGTGCFVRVTNTVLMTVNLTSSQPTGVNATRKAASCATAPAVLTWP